MTLSIAQLPVQVDQYFVAGDQWRFQVGPLVFSGLPQVIAEQTWECEYRDQTGAIIVTPDVVPDPQTPTIGFVTLDPDTTRFMQVSPRPIWGLRWTNPTLNTTPRTLVWGNVFVMAEVVLAPTPDPVANGNGNGISQVMEAVN